MLSTTVRYMLNWDIVLWPEALGPYHDWVFSYEMRDNPGFMYTKRIARVSEKRIAYDYEGNMYYLGLPATAVRENWHSLKEKVGVYRAIKALIDMKRVQSEY